MESGWDKWSIAAQSVNKLADTSLFKSSQWSHRPVTTVHSWANHSTYRKPKAVHQSVPPIAYPCHCAQTIQRASCAVSHSHQHRPPISWSALISMRHDKKLLAQTQAYFGVIFRQNWQRWTLLKKSRIDKNHFIDGWWSRVEVGQQRNRRGRCLQLEVHSTYMRTYSAPIPRIERRLPTTNW